MVLLLKCPYYVSSVRRCVSPLEGLQLFCSFIFFPMRAVRRCVSPLEGLQHPEDLADLSGIAEVRRCEIPLEGLQQEGKKLVGMVIGR